MGLLAGPTTAGQYELQIDSNGILTGATGVLVGGASYDVEFLDGTCAEVFAGCDDLSDFIFQTEADATAASQALLDMVFVGDFDAHPELTQGCTHDQACQALTRFSSTQHMMALNWIEGGFDGVIGPFEEIDTDTSIIEDMTWARWSLRASPNPARSRCSAWACSVSA